MLPSAQQSRIVFIQLRTHNKQQRKAVHHTTGEPQAYSLIARDPSRGHFAIALRAPVLQFRLKSPLFALLHAPCPRRRAGEAELGRLSFLKSRVGCLPTSKFLVPGGRRVDEARCARASHAATASQRLFAAEREQQAPTRRVVVGRERALQVRLVR